MLVTPHMVVVAGMGVAEAAAPGKGGKGGSSPGHQSAQRTASCVTVATYSGSPGLRGAVRTDTTSF